MVDNEIRSSLWYWQMNKDRVQVFNSKMLDGSAWPKISIVTPSFNQGQFIEETIRSVIFQGYPNLEYFIIDGGSTDNTVEIIKKYEDKITYWVSEKDNGQTHAINKGFSKATGEIVAYLNSDDIYMPYTLRLVAEIFTKFKNVQWLTGFKTHLNNGYVISPDLNATALYDKKLFRKGLHILPILGWNQQPSTFWTHELFQKVGGKFNESIDGNMDINLWIRFSDYEPLYFLNAMIGLMRKHPEQKSQKIDNSWALFEEQQKYLKLYPLFLRKMIKLGYQIPGLRFLLHRFVYKPTGKMIVWNHLINDWEIRVKSIF
jgi:glycosyltransferase involved in cell wall biosynthesis